MLCENSELTMLKEKKRTTLNLSKMLGLKLSHKQRLDMAESWDDWAAAVSTELTNFPVPAHELEGDLVSQGTA